MDSNTFIPGPFVRLYRKVTGQSSLDPVLEEARKKDRLLKKEEQRKRVLATSSDDDGPDVEIEDGSIIADFFKSIGDAFVSDGGSSETSSESLTDILPSGDSWGSSGSDFSGPD